MTRIDRYSDSQANALAEGRRFAPRSLSALVRWFVQGWRAEVPEDIHGRGVEKERPGRIERADGSGVTDPGGGNRLGAPSYDPDFRAYVFGNPSRTEHAKAGDRENLDGSYSSPMRWTVEWLGRSRHPLMAAVLRRLGRTGDWHDLSVTCTTCSQSVTLPDEYAEAIIRDALNLAAKHYREEPEAKVA